MEIWGRTYFEATRLESALNMSPGATGDLCKLLATKEGGMVVNGDRVFYAADLVEAAVCRTPGERETLRRSYATARSRTVRAEALEAARAMNKPRH